MDDEDLDENGVTALRIFNKAMIETGAYIKDHQEVLSGLNKSTEMIRRHKLKQLLDFANSAIEEIAEDHFQDFDGQFTLGNISGYLDDFYEELDAMDSEQFELFWGFHNPETSDNFWGNVKSALNLGS